MILAVLTLAGLISRLAAAWQLPMFHDEGHSFLAARMVAERGAPVLPSGVLYLHGATLSYLLAPLARLNLVTLDHLDWLRSLVAVIGALVIPATFQLARMASGSNGMALIAAGLLAFDPVSTMWGGYLRMYALLELFVCLLVICFFRLVVEGSATPRRVQAGFVGFAWLAVFTHLSAALLLPAIAVVLWFRFRAALLKQQRVLVLLVALAALAPVVHLGLTTLIGQGGTRAVRETDWLPGISFLGDDQVDPTRLLSPDLNAWYETFSGQPFPDSLAQYFPDWLPAPLSGLAPPLILMLSALLAGGLLFGVGRYARDDGARWRLISLLSLHWFPVLVMAALARMASGRYFVMVSPLAWTLVALGLGMLWSLARETPANRGAATTARVLAAAAGVVLLGYFIAARLTIGQWSPWPFGDPRAALAWLNSAHAPGQLVINQFPVITWLGLDESDDLRFLSRYDTPNEFDRYARFEENGAPVDYWLGEPMIGTMPDLCTTLALHPGSWVVWADYHFTLPLMAISDQMVILANSGTVRFDQDGTRVLEVLPVASWNPAAVSYCQTAGVDVRTLAS